MYGQIVRELQVHHEIRVIKNQEGPQGPGAHLDINKLPPDYVQVVKKDSSGNYYVAS